MRPNRPLDERIVNVALTAAVILGVVMLALMFTPRANAATDLGSGVCQQTDGQLGMWNGTTADDDGCVTDAEYEQLYSAANLVDAGVIDSYTDNGDGTTTLDFGGDVRSTVETNPLDRTIAVGPEPEPDAPTVRDIFDQLIESVLEALRFGYIQ